MFLKAINIFIILASNNIIERNIVKSLTIVAFKVMAITQRLGQKKVITLDTFGERITFIEI